MGGPLAPIANSIFETAVLACKSSMAASNFRFYDRNVTVSSGSKLRYIKVTWDPGTPEENEKNFNLARTIFWEHLSEFMYMTAVDSQSFAIAIREITYEHEVDPGY